MNLLLHCNAISKRFGTRTLFEDLTFSIHAGDRIGLIGLNGSGKSTLLKILINAEQADGGVISKKRDLKIGYLPQECTFPDVSPKDVLIQTLAIKNPHYEQESVPIAEMWLSKLGFTGKEPSASLLSGGWKKRLGLANELILSPDLLLLDEPTNHLDLEGIAWLESFLRREASSYLLVSHDRYFLEHATTRVMEIGTAYPKGIFSVEGSYSLFLSKKKEFLQGQLQQEHSMATKMRRETEWLRQGVKARTTKSQARIDQAADVIQEHAHLVQRNQQRSIPIRFASTERETKKLLSVHNVSKTLGQRSLFHHLHFTLSPGTRMGLLGPNGSGKTTLLRLLAGEIAPDTGTLKIAEGLQIVYFDQHRTQLPLDMSLKEALSPKGEYVEFHGRSIHVNGWCKRFLFSPDLLALPIRQLSGGERARITIARLLLQPADLLLLDEPTNDLDIPTLEALEESLLDFPGAVVLITHDRYMIDRLCTTLLALGNPEDTRFFADSHQWEQAQRVAPSAPKLKTHKDTSHPTSRSPKPKLSYRNQQECASIEEKIMALEAHIQTLTLCLERPDVIADAIKLKETCTEIGIAEAEIERLYLRWNELC